MRWNYFMMRRDVYILAQLLAACARSCDASLSSSGVEVVFTNEDYKLIKAYLVDKVTRNQHENLLTVVELVQ